MYSPVNHSTVHASRISRKILSRPRVGSIFFPDTLIKSCLVLEGSAAQAAIRVCLDSEEKVGINSEARVMLICRDNVTAHSPGIYRDSGSFNDEQDTASAPFLQLTPVPRPAAPPVHSHRGLAASAPGT